jgi:hypothetical protein
MWGASWANIMLTVIDAHRTDYHNDKDNDKDNGKASGRSGSAEVLDLSDPKNMEFLKKFAQ